MNSTPANSTPLPPLQPFTPGSSAATPAPIALTRSKPRRRLSSNVVGVSDRRRLLQMLQNVEEVSPGSDGTSEAGETPSIRSQDEAHLEHLSSTRICMDEDKELLIHQALPAFENTLLRFVQALSKYDFRQDLAETLMETETQFCEAVDELVEHQQAAQTIAALERVSEGLDDKIREMIRKLAECRRELRNYQPNNENQSTLSSADLLTYATRIANFTTAPPYFRERPEHSKLPWPIEDEMRKGLLALMEVGKDKTELGELADPEKFAHTTANGAAPNGAAPVANGVAQNHNNGYAMERRLSTGYGSENDGDTNMNGRGGLAGLDIFDDDDDDDDD
ncbi:Mediator of RNA polymerase II transcription subunit 4 [Yarrowia sp. C11]|nr:Mediator of RNA polymerase II transcription subunit 4 [Yarrowia sp. C11]KAG5365033.1 Mediator of RNA polymerase II transcription subunit 4 [Yarrowia sp. E02]